MLIRPIQSEKAYKQQSKHTYMFNVPLNASKQSIQKVVQEQYGVTVISVRVIIRDGKKTKFSRGKHAYPGTTYRQDKKIAYVTLKTGDKIKVFDEEPVDEAKTTEAVTSIKPSDEKETTESKKAGLFTRRRTGNRGDK